VDEKALDNSQANFFLLRRNKVLNLFSVMVKKRLRTDEEKDDEQVACPDAQGKSKYWKYLEG
jgi:hypothetical protein